MTFKHIELVASGKELKTILSRALNTWEPINYPPWALSLCDALEDNDYIHMLCIGRNEDAQEGTNPGTTA